MRVGDDVSFNGDAVKVTELEFGATGDAMSAWVSRDEAEPIKVRYAALKPLANIMPVKTIMLQMPKAGEMVIGRDAQGLLEAGIMIMESKSVLELEMMEGNDTGLSWLPVWVKDGVFVRRKQKPVGFTRVKVHAVIACVCSC